MNGNDVIEEAIRTLLSGSREEMNKLADNISALASTLTFTFPLGGIREGAQLAIDDEIYRVWTVDEAGQYATVQPAVLGSTSSTHDAGSLIYVNPRFPRFSVRKAMNDELMALSAPSNGLYQMASTEFATNGTATDYQLPATTIDVYDVLQSEPGPSDFWSRVPNWTWNPSASGTMFATGKSLHIPVSVPGRSVRVLYKTGFSPVNDPTTDLATETGLPAEMQDILSLGVLLRLGPSREIKRNFTEAQGGDSRRADEVQSGAVSNSFAWVRNQRSARITDERLRLERSYPPRYPAR